MSELYEELKDLLNQEKGVALATEWFRVKSM